jgi:hypothetical protein
MPFGAIEVAVKFKPQLTQKIMAQRKEKALEIIDANAGPKKLCVFYNDINFHEAYEVPLGACCEVSLKEKMTF